VFELRGYQFFAISLGLGSSAALQLAAGIPSALSCTSLHGPLLAGLRAAGHGIPATTVAGVAISAGLGSSAALQLAAGIPSALSCTSLRGPVLAGLADDRLGFRSAADLGGRFPD
jgi:hypothetical protein